MTNEDYCELNNIRQCVTTMLPGGVHACTYHDEDGTEFLVVNEEIRDKEVRYEEYMTEDAEYLIVAFGSASRIVQKTIELCRNEGMRIGMLRPITLWPFPTKAISDLAAKVKGILCVEINAGQMVDDIRLAVEGRVPVSQYGRLGGIVPTPEEVMEEVEKLRR